MSCKRSISGGGEAQGVGVNYANKCSDTNPDEEELAEGGGGSPGSHCHSFLFTLRQELISFAAF